MRHGTPAPQAEPPADDLELGLVTADIEPFLILSRLCECDGTCTCSDTTDLPKGAP